MVISALLLAAALLANPAEGPPTPVRIIVNASNPVASLDKITVSRMFLKKQPRWETGQAVRPIEPADPRLQEAFSQAFHGKSRKAVDQYWRELIFSAREVPPEEKAKEAAVVDAVSKDAAAIGYVELEPSDPRVKVVIIRR